MRIFGLLLVMLLTAVATLAFHNWEMYIEPKELALGFTSMRAPLGLIMLGVLVLVTLLFSLNLVYLQSSLLLELRRHAREMQANKELVEKAELSRFTTLKESFVTELAKQNEKDDALKAELFEKAEEIEIRFKTILEQLENTLDAYIGEFEDRLEKANYLTSDEDDSYNLNP